MKKLLLSILISTVLNAQANDKYLFTDTKTDLNGILSEEAITWIFNTNDKQLTLKTETQDVFYNITEVKKIETIFGYYKKYSLDNGSAVYVNSETLEVIFCTDNGQYIFAVGNDKYFTKNN